MSEKVVAFPGFTVPTPRGEPVASVVEILRGLLEKAEAGQVVAVAVAVVIDTGDPSPLLHSNFSARAGSSSDLYAALGRLNRGFGVWLYE